MWKKKKSDLRKLFKGQEIDLEHLAENLQMITVEISDLAVSWLLKAELHEKMDFARVLHNNYTKIFEFVMEAPKITEWDR